MDDRKYEVYKIVNKINSKVYVGITNQGIKTRWYKHCSDAIHDSQFPLHRAIRKYGQDNFDVILLEECNSSEELCEREKYWIKQLGSLVKDNKGYNVTEGGDGTFGRYHSEETKEKIRQKAVGRLYDSYTKQKMSLHSAKAKRVSQYTLDGKYIATYNSTAEAARILFGNNKRRTRIASCANGKQKTALGYIWSYDDKPPTIEKKITAKPTKRKQTRLLVGWYMSEEQKQKISETNKKRYADPEFKANSYFVKHNPRQKAILQYTLNGEFVKEYKSVTEAAKAVNATTHTNIAKCARGERKKAAGYIWKYKDNNKPLNNENNESNIKANLS